MNTVGSGGDWLKGRGSPLDDDQRRDARLTLTSQEFVTILAIDGRRVLRRRRVSLVPGPRGHLRWKSVAVLSSEENSAIRRPMRPLAPVQKDGPRVNKEIRVLEVQLIDAEGRNLGPTKINDALQAAEDAGLDLVEIAPNSVPPVCKLLDYGKYKYQNQKKAAEARKNQKIVEVKEIKMRPNIDDHDYDVKLRAMRRFFEEGDKVKVTLRFRGREMAHQDLGLKLLVKVREEVGELAKVESDPSLEGRQMTMVLAPR
ncbi:translation initiation factor IF-3 [Hansschlegelia beijingensis]|uniref:Translation initiation factor IF-3 n=1 Tax=Hansschlegelia beijingensis TaxID=1133344 RepID=A0A7W6D4J2_9HYPH|nr:translation initiation factor IF-3 [Hansschlegelia beijingensis]